MADANKDEDAKGQMAVTTEHVLLAIHCEKRRPGDTNYNPSKITKPIDCNMDTYMKWQFVLHSPEFLSSVAAKIKSSHGYSLSVSTDGTCTVTIGKVETTPDSNKIVGLVAKNILSPSSAIESFSFPHGGLNSQYIVDSIMNSEWGRQHRIYAEVDKNPNADLVNFAYDTRNVTTSCRSRIIKDAIDRAKQQMQDTELSFELIYKNVIEKEYIVKDFKMKFQLVSLSMFCTNNRFIVRMSGPEKDVSAAEGYIKAIRSVFKMNQMSLTDIKHFDRWTHSLATLRMILDSVFQDKEFKVGNCYWSVDDERLYILAREDISADKITSRFKKCLASVTCESEIKKPEEVLASCVDPVTSDMLLEKRVEDNKVYIVGKKDVVYGLQDKFDIYCKAVTSKLLIVRHIGENASVPKSTKSQSYYTAGGPIGVFGASNIHPLQIPGAEVPLNEDVAKYLVKTSKLEIIKKSFGVDVKFAKGGQVLEIYGDADAIKNASNAVEAMAKTVITADIHVQCPGIAGGYFKSPEGSALLHTLECDCTVTTEVIGSSDEGASGGDGDRECSSRIWTFTVGHAVTLCLGDQKNYWQDLLVENQEMKSNELTENPVVSENQYRRKTVKLQVPKYNGNNKAKVTFCQSIRKVLEAAKTYDCTKVCIDLDKRYDWKSRKFDIQLFTEVAGHLSQTGLIPTTVTFCTAERATYREACQVCRDAVANHGAVESGEPRKPPVTGLSTSLKTNAGIDSVKVKFTGLKHNVETASAELSEQLKRAQVSGNRGVMDPSPKIKDKEIMNSGSTSDGFEVIDAPSDSSDDFPTNSELNFDSFQLPVTDITRDISLPPENIKRQHATVIHQSSEVHVSVSIPMDDSLPETIQEKTTQGHRLEVDKTNETFFSMAENHEPSRNVDDARKPTAKVSCDSSTGAVTDISNSDTKTQESWVKDLHLMKFGPQWVLSYCGNKITIPPKLAKNKTTTLSVDADNGDVFIVSEDDMYKLSRTNDNKIKLTILDSAEIDIKQEKSDACGATDGETYFKSGQVDTVTRVENTAALSAVTHKVKAISTPIDELPNETVQKKSDSTAFSKSENAEKTEDNAQDDLSGDSKHEYLETVESMESNQLSVNDDHLVVNTKPRSNAEKVSRGQKLQMEKSVLSKKTVGQGRKYDNTETVGSEKGKSDSDKTLCVQQEKKHGINEKPTAVSEAGDYVDLVKTVTPAIVGGSAIIDDVESLIQGNLSVNFSAASDNQQPTTGTSATVHSTAGCGDKQGQMKPVDAAIGKGLPEKPNVATDKTEVYIVGKKDVVYGLEDKCDIHCKAMTSKPLIVSHVGEDASVPKSTKSQSYYTTFGPFFSFSASNIHQLQIPGAEVPLNEDVAKYLVKTSKLDIIKKSFGVDVKFAKGGKVLEIYGGADAIKNASNAVEATAKTVLSADVECPGIAGGYFKSPEGSALLHTLECDCTVTTEVIGSSDEGASGGDGDRECSSRIWTFTAGHAVTVCLGDQKNYWQDLLVENQEMKSNELTENPVVSQTQDGRKLTVKLQVPKYNGNRKAKDTVCQSICKVLEAAKTYECTKVCIDLDQRYDWPYRKFNVQLFTEVAGHLSQTGLIRTTVTFCTAEQATYREACQVCCHAVAKHGAVESVEPQKPPVTASTNTGRIRIIKGYLDTVKADAIVNTTGRDLRLDSGLVSKTLLAKAGAKMQEECLWKCKNGIHFGEIVHTNGYYLNCRYVLHTTLDAYKEHEKGLCLQNLQKLVFNCMRRMVSLKCKTIAFPAIGTGNLGYPKDKVASVMFSAADQFMTVYPDSGIQDVMFVVYAGDQGTVQAFENVERQKAAGAFKQAAPLAGFSKDLHIGHMTISAECGTLAAARAQSVIYLWEKQNIYTVPFDSNVLLKHLDDTARRQFTDHRNDKDMGGEVLTTGGGRLPHIQMVIHVPCDDAPGDIIRAFRAGLKMAQTKKLVSAVVLFPSAHPLLKYGEKLAHGLIDAVKDVASKPSLLSLMEVCLLVEGEKNFSRIRNYIDSSDSNSRPGLSTSLKNKVDVGSVKVKFTGLKHNVETASVELSEQLKRAQVSGNRGPLSPVEADATITCGPTAEVMDRGFEYQGLNTVNASSNKNVPSREEDRGEPATYKYVMVVNIPQGTTETQLISDLLTQQFPVRQPTIVYPGGTQALLICQSSKDATTLDGYRIKGYQYTFSKPKPPVLKKFTPNLAVNIVNAAKKKGILDDLTNKLEAIDVRIQCDSKDNIQLTTNTTIQLDKSKQIIETFAEHKLKIPRQKTGSGFIDIDAVDCSSIAWDACRIVKNDLVQQLQKGPTRLSYDNGNLMYDGNRTLEYSDKDQKLISQLKDFLSKDFDEMPVEDTGKDVNRWCRDIAALLGGDCCVYIPDRHTVIAYADKYETIQIIRHQLNIKQGKVKQTGRGRHTRALVASDNQMR